MKRGGKFVNPLNQNFPRSEPLPKALLEDFQQKIADPLTRLEARKVAQLTPAP